MSFKQMLFKDLNDTNIKDIVGENIFFLKKAEHLEPNLYVEYEIIDEQYTDYSSNRFNSIEYFIQVDIFSKVDYEELENTIKRVLIERGYKPLSGADLYEDKTRLFHKAMRFYYKESI